MPQVVLPRIILPAALIIHFFFGPLFTMGGFAGFFAWFPPFFDMVPSCGV